MRIYVGNLSYDVTEEDLKKHFEPFGQVQSASIIQDKMTGRSKGFGFIEMDSKTEAQEAIDKLNEKDFQGRKLAVNEARPRTENRMDHGGRDRPYGGGGGGGRGGSSRGGGRDRRF